MKGFLIAVCMAACLAFPLVSLAQQTQPVVPGSQGHVSLILHDNWRQIPAETQMEQQFRMYLSPGGGVAPHLYTESSAIYRARVVDSKWPATIPVVIHQDPDGRVAEQVSAPLIPSWFPRRPWLSMRPWLRPRGGCPDGTCPQVQPAVEPPAAVDVIVQPPAYFPPPEPIREDSPVALIVLAGLLILLAFAVGAIIPVVRHFKNR